MKIRGKVKKGLGEGKKFMSLKEYREGFYKIFNYYPYRGTLNLELDKKNLENFNSKIKTRKKRLVKGFKKNGKIYREVKVVKAKIGKKIIGVVFPFYKHHPKNIVEIIAKENLRREYKLKDGDEIEFEI
ncbi:MAG: CTP-dependent riboflavin kinase [Candidatus Micrarchaeota archaeon]|nr:CTP-dependent riboflavin kinase [Candidatus Micrarchaeota archaeon]